MPLTFPIATSAKTALSASAQARTSADARRAIGSEVALVSDWLRPGKTEYAKLTDKIDLGLRDGYVQVYEDKSGKPIIAVTYWKKLKAPKAEAPPKAGTGADDDTDDLYFSKANKKRAATRRRRKSVDLRQMDLFTGPDQKGHETPDPANPRVILVEEEGMGETFGAGPRALGDSTKSRK